MRMSCLGCIATNVPTLEWMFNRYRQERRALRKRKVLNDDGREDEYAELPHGFYVQMLKDHGFNGEYSQFLKRRNK